MAKILKNILFYKFSITSFVIESKPKMLSVSDGPTYLPNDTVNYGNSFAAQKRVIELIIDLDFN